MGKNQFDIPDEAYQKLVAQTEAFFVGAGNLLKEAYNGPAPKPSDGPFMLSYPPAHDPATALDNARHGYGEEGIRGGKLVSDFTIKARSKRLEDGFKVADAHGVPRDTFEFYFLLGRTGFDDKRDVPEPGNDLPMTPSFQAPFEGIDAKAGRDLATELAAYWAGKAAPGGGLPSGAGTQG